MGNSKLVAKTGILLVTLLLFSMVSYAQITAPTPSTFEVKSGDASSLTVEARTNFDSIFANNLNAILTNPDEGRGTYEYKVARAVEQARADAGIPDNVEVSAHLKAADGSGLDYTSHAATDLSSVSISANSLREFKQGEPFNVDDIFSDLYEITEDRGNIIVQEITNDGRYNWIGVEDGVITGTYFTDETGTTPTIIQSEGMFIATNNVDTSPPPPLVVYREQQATGDFEITYTSNGIEKTGRYNLLTEPLRSIDGELQGISSGDKVYRRIGEGDTTNLLIVKSDGTIGYITDGVFHAYTTQEGRNVVDRTAAPGQEAGGEQGPVTYRLQARDANIPSDDLARDYAIIGSDGSEIVFSYEEYGEEAQAKATQVQTIMSNQDIGNINVRVADFDDGTDWDGRFWDVTLPNGEVMTFRNENEARTFSTELRNNKDNVAMLLVIDGISMSDITEFIEIDTEILGHLVTGNPYLPEGTIGDTYNPPIRLRDEEGRPVTPDELGEQLQQQVREEWREQRNDDFTWYNPVDYAAAAWHGISAVGRALNPLSWFGGDDGGEDSSSNEKSASTQSTSSTVCSISNQGNTKVDSVDGNTYICDCGPDNGCRWVLQRQQASPDWARCGAADLDCDSFVNR